LLRYFRIGYPLRLSIQVIHLGYLSSLSIQVIHLGYLSRLSIQVIYSAYLSRLSIQVIHLGYLSSLSVQVIRPGYLSRLSARPEDTLCVSDTSSAILTNFCRSMNVARKKETARYFSSTINYVSYRKIRKTFSEAKTAKL
jgi:hypothetical protein